MYSSLPRELIGLDEHLGKFHPPAMVFLEYDEDGVDPLVTLQVITKVFTFPTMQCYFLWI